MVTFFISDLHLNSTEKKIYSNFIHFLYNKAYDADELYILGDLFEVWIGNDNPEPLYRNVVYAIKNLVKSAKSCFFIPGNRDFLIEKKFAYKSGVTLLPEHTVLNLYGRKILIMHGDTLCTNDLKYQRFKAKINKTWIKKLFLVQPFFIRTQIASIIRKQSRKVNAKNKISVMDVNQQSVVKIMQKYCVQWLIHGHTHRPYIHKLIINNKLAFRIALGSWYDNMAVILKVTPESMELIHFP